MKEDGSKYCGCLYYAANSLSRTITRMAEEEFSITGLAPSYAFLMMSVNDRPGINAGDISRELQLSPSTVTRLIEKLENKGLVERRPAGKFIEVFPTGQGHRLQVKIKEAWISLYRRYSDLLGEENARKLTDEVYRAGRLLDRT